MSTVEIRGLQELDENFRRMADEVHDFLVRTTDKSVKYVHSQVPPYPSPSRGPYPFVSVKQYLFVIINIIKGTLQVPYRRTGSGGIGGSITTEVRELGTDVIGVIGTNKDYAPWVISSEVVPMGTGPQAAYHRGVWWTLQEEVNKSWDGVVRIFESALRDFIRSRS